MNQSEIFKVNNDYHFNKIFCFRVPLQIGLCLTQKGRPLCNGTSDNFVLPMDHANFSVVWDGFSSISTKIALLFAISFDKDEKVKASFGTHWCVQHFEW